MFLDYFFKAMILFEGQNKSLNSSLIVSSVTCNQALWEVRWMDWSIYFSFLPEWIFHCNFCFFVFWLEVEMMETVCIFFLLKTSQQKQNLFYFSKYYLCCWSLNVLVEQITDFPELEDGTEVMFFCNRLHSTQWDPANI